MTDSEENAYYTVEINTTSQFSAKTYVESISYPGLLLIFFFFILFEGSFIYAGIKAPKIVNRTGNFHSINNQNFIDPIFTNSLIENLNSNYEFFEIKFNFIRKTDISDKKIPFNTFGLIKLISIKNIQIFNYSFLQSGKVKFYSQDLISDEFFLYKVPIKSKVKLEINLNFSGYFEDIIGIKYIYQFADPNLKHFLNINRIILTIFSSLLFITYFFSLKFDSLTTYDKVIILFGLSTILSTNPFHELFPNKNLIPYFDIFFMLFFFFMFRFSSIYILLGLIYGNKNVPTSFSLFSSIFSLLYCLTESLTQNTQNSIHFLTTYSENFFSFHLLKAFHIIFILMILLILSFSFFFNQISKYFITFSFFLIFLPLILTLIFIKLIYFLKLFENTCLTSHIYITVFVFTSNLLLFIQQITYEGYYEKIINTNLSQLNFDIEESINE